MTIVVIDFVEVRLLASPATRWAILLAYCTGCATVLYASGYLKSASTWSPKRWGWLHAASLIVGLPIHLSAWESTVYAFKRPFNPFATMAYPLCMTLDSLLWLCVFDAGKSASMRVGARSTYARFIAGWILLSVFVGVHRVTFEQWYLPRHHPPHALLPKNVVIMRAIPLGTLNSVLSMAVYHFKGDPLWFVMTRFASDLFIACRIRLPAPWSNDGMEWDENAKWDWVAH